MPMASEAVEDEAVVLTGTEASPEAAALEILLVDSPIHEQRLVAQRLLEEHLMNGRAAGFHGGGAAQRRSGPGDVQVPGRNGHRGKYPAGRDAVA